MSLRSESVWRKSPPLIALFLARFNEQYQRHKVLSPETAALLLEQRWSGNVRELENIVRRLVVLVNDAPVHETLRACLRREISDAVSEPSSSSPFGSEGLRGHRSERGSGSGTEGHGGSP
jgi:DNA-binding NtrC family response regulator